MDVKTREIVDFGKLGKIEESVLKFPTLYSRDKAGKFRLWQIVAGLTGEEVEPDRDDTDGAWLDKIEWIPVTKEYIERGELPEGAIGVYYTISGQEDGAVKITKPTYVTEGTNIGKKNYTTAFTGALRKVMTDYNKKIKKGSVTKKADVKMRNDTTTIEDLIAEGENKWRVFPMAFHSLEKETNWKHIHFPAYIQPKYDGTRLIIAAVPDAKTKTVKLDNYSRGRETFDVKHVVQILQAPLQDYPGVYLDGELWKKGFGLQDISGSSRRMKDKDSKREKQIELEFHIFDAFYLDKQMGFDERAELVADIFKSIAEEHPDQTIVVEVPNKIVKTKEEAIRVYEGFLKQNLEGAIIRNADSIYEYGLVKEERTYKSLKLKPREDAEYKISGYKEGAGKNKGLIIWICDSPDGKKQFSVSPNWTEEKRAEVFTALTKNPKLFEKIRGEEATIQYSTISKDGIPQQPKFLRFKKQSIEI